MVNNGSKGFFILELKPGPPIPPTVHNELLLQTGDNILLESGSRLDLQH